MERQASARNSYLGKSRRFPIEGSHVLIFLSGILLILNVLLVSSIMFSDQGIPGFRRQSQQVEEVEGKINKLKEDNQKLFRQIQDFRSNTRAQERFVRQQLGWAKENEIVFEF